MPRPFADLCDQPHSTDEYEYIHSGRGVDGREIIFDRAREESDIVLLDLPAR